MDAETRRVWAERAVNALNEAFPWSKYENWGQCERLRSHGLAAAELVTSWRFDSQAAGDLLGKLGSYLDDRGLYEEAEPLYQRSLAIKEKALGPDHPSVAITLNNLAGLYQSQGRYARIFDLAPLTARVYTLTRRSATISPPERGGG